VLETRLKKTIEELSSAQVIIEILRSEVNIEMELLRNQCDSGNTNIQTVGVQMEQLQINNEGSDEVVDECTDGQKEDLISNQTSEFNITSKSDDESWKIVDRGYKNIPSANHTMYYQIPVIINRYELPRNSANYDEMVWDTKNTYELVNKNKDGVKVLKKRNKQKKKKNKIMVIGDSHAQGCAAELKVHLKKDWEVQGFVCPGARVDIISTGLEREIKQLSTQDVAVVWGGSKDVGRNESQQAINKIQKFVETNEHTNVILMEAPHRHDLMQESCVNKEVKKYNTRMRKYMKIYKNVTVLEVNVDRSGYTTHGQHMNIKGKKLLAKRIAETIKRTVKVCTMKAIVMKEKDDPSIEDQVPGKAMDGVCDSTQVDDGNKRRQENEDSGKTMDGAGEGGASIGSTQVEGENNGKKEYEIATKTSGRSRKTPVTRTDDFLWTVNCKKHPK
jgi:hypothetical protein